MPKTGRRRGVNEDVVRVIVRKGGKHAYCFTLYDTDPETIIDMIRDKIKEDAPHALR
jgi:transposase-like protein